jgi:hypothetical protein
VLGWCLVTFWITKIHHTACIWPCELLYHTSGFCQSFIWRLPASLILRVAFGCKPQTIFFAIRYLYVLNLFACKVLLAGVCRLTCFHRGRWLLLSKPYQVVIPTALVGQLLTEKVVLF